MADGAGIISPISLELNRLLDLAALASPLAWGITLFQLLAVFG